MELNKQPYPTNPPSDHQVVFIRLKLEIYDKFVKLKENYKHVA